MSVAITCPDCGHVGQFDSIRRSAAEFCPKCDYPLFWVKSDLPSTGVGDLVDSTRRRLPGAGGRATVGSIACPECSELNRLSAVTCLRCGAELEPKPVDIQVVPAPVEEPEVMVLPSYLPPEKRRRRWPWVVLAVVLVIAVVVVILVV